MGARRESEEARYLQDVGMSIHKASERRPKKTPPRGTMPIAMLEAETYDRDTAPLFHALAGVEQERSAMRAQPTHARCLRLLRAGNTLKEDPTLVAHVRRWKTVQARRRTLLDQIADRAAEVPTVGYLHLREEPATHPLVDLALQLLAARQTNASSCVARDHILEVEQKAILRHFKSVFKIGIENAWVLPVLDAIERAALERQSADTRRHNLTAEQLATCAAADPPGTENKHAARVLLDSHNVMQTWPVRFDLPSWLDAPIVAFILTRFGFARGGGGGKISRATFLKLLAHPARLAAKLEQNPQLGRRLKRQLTAMRRPQVFTVAEAPLDAAPARAR